MSFNDEYLKLRKKRLEEEQKNKPSPSFEFVSGPYQNATKTEYDIAPVQSQKAEDKGKNTGSGLFKAGTFADGYQFGDVTGAILGTAGDVATGFVHGVAGVGEGISDLIQYGGAGVSKLMGNDDLADLLLDAGELDFMDMLFGSFREATNIDDSSLLGDFGYIIPKALGQAASIYATAGLGKAAGLGKVGTTVLSSSVTGASSMGSGMSEAYQGGATDGEAFAHGANVGAIDVLTELLFGGLGKGVNAIGISKGISSLDDVFAKKLSSKISNQFLKNATEFGVKAGAEGFEEVLAGIGSAVSKKLTYMSDEELSQLVKDENLLEQFAVGAIVSGIAQGGDLVKSTKTGRDFITNFSGNEEAVIEKVYNDRVAEAEQDGTKLTNKEKNELYEQVQNDMRKGYISTDTIESVLGGETYKTYKDTVDSEDAILKEFEELGKKQNATLAEQSRYAELQAQVKEIKSNSNRNNLKSKLSEEVYNSVKEKDFYLAESYNERARRGTAFEADLSQYDDKTAEVVKRAMDSGILNNTRRTHEFVDMLAKISADKGVLFDFTNNQKLKESGFAVNGASINGYVTKDGITVNIDSSKAHNSIVGHEITHVLEGTELYGELQTAIFEYAKSKNEYDSRRKSLEELYKNVEGADIDAELTADLVGDYLFTDEKFINTLSTKHRNVFQKIYDEIKYLLKVATKGSKEARQLEKVKRAFDKAYRDNKAPTSNPDIRFSLSKSVEETPDLIAAHNLSSNNLLKSLELGGLPMPSVAITRADSVHNDFGDISLILRKDAIDPKAHKENKIYSGDAWTPVYPTIEYKPNDKVTRRISEKYYELAHKYGYDDLRPMYRYVNDTEDALKRDKGEQGLLNSLYNDTKMMQVYLLDTGKGKVETVQKEIRTELSDAEVAMNEFFIKELGEDVVDGIMFNGIGNPVMHRKQYWESYGEQIEETYEKLLKEEYGFTDEEVKNVFEGMKTYDFLKLVRDAYWYRKNGRVITKTEADTKATDEAIREAASEGYKEWVDGLFKGIEEKTGIRNNRDYFTPSGNRRSWDALHWENTLENVVRVMKEQGNGENTFFTGHGIWGAAANEYKSIDDVKADSDRLKRLPQEEYVKIRGDIGTRLQDIAQRIMDKTERNQFIAADNALACIIDAVRNSRTKSGILNELKQYRQLTVTEKDVDDIISLVADIAKMPTEYFEAKPRRAVGFDEVGVFVIPRNADVKLKQELLNRGYAIAEYDPDVEGDRQKVVNSFEEYKFSLSNVNETPKRYGNYNIFGEDIRLEAPIQEEVAPVDETVDKVVAPTEESLNNLELQHKIIKQKYMNASKVNDTEAVRRYSEELIDLERQIAEAEAKTVTTEKEVAPKKRTPSQSVLANFTRESTYSGGFKFKGAYNADGKQYLSNGMFAAEFNDVDESIPHNKDFPLAKIQNILNEAVDGQSTRKYAIEFDKIVEINKANKGNSAIVAVGRTPFDAKYIEAVMRAIPNATFALSNYRGAINTLVAVGDNGRAILMPVRAGDNLSPDYEAQEIKPTLETVAPMPSEPTLYELEQKQAELEDTIRTAMESNDPNAPKLIDEYGALLDTLAKRKAEESAMESERLASLDDMEAPPEVEAPYYGESADTAPENPFEDRDIKAVGNRKVKAYMYENPEVKPFFQEEANILLGELRDGTKGERWFNDQLYYDSGGELGFGGTKRHVSADIAYLLDNLNFSYADIEKGLNAIIEDHGAENNAASKRIEFILNDRLLKGYTEFINGYDIPPNQDYINLLNEKQITEYSEEARAKFFEVADEYAPPMEDIAPIAPVVENTTVNKPIEDAPIAEAYEAIKPKKETSSEPRLKRVKEGEQSPDGKERKWVGTSTESEAVDGKILPDDLDQEAIHYQPISNKKTLDTANAKLNGMGYEASLAYFNSQFANKKTTVEDIVLGERLIQEAIKRGDTKTAGELIEDVAILGTELGQKVQALSIIKRLTPEGQLRMLQRTVERGKTREDKAYEGVEITQEMIDKILKAYNEDGSFDQTKLNEAVEDAKQKIADQMKVTVMDKVNAWRYLSMLGNPKTHIRNLVSNVAMRGTTAAKNVVARTIETFAPIENRTKTWRKASDEVKAFSQKTAIEMKDILSDGGKYNEDASIKQKRAIFKNKILNGVYEFNSDMLSKEDWWFSKPAFTKALSEYLTANGIRTEQDIQNNPKIVAKAKKYATEQSQIATFRQYSWLANKINEIEHKNVATQIAVGAVLPFKKTPINIAKTALNYSPLGFAKTLTYDAAQVKNGKMEASELVDHLAQNVTGSALVLVGYMLASAGFINGAGEDDKEGDYDYQLGEQAYSINIGDATFSLSWLSPIAMPLFVGANAYEQLVEGKEWNGDVVVETLAQTLDPLSEMSFLSSLDNVLSSYDSGLEKFAGIAQSAGQSYITQFVPTLSSQIAAVMDDTKRSTKVAADSDFKFVDETVNKLKYKIPFLRETLEPSTDIWGNEIKQSENLIERAFETFIAPYSKKDNISSDIDEEIKALYGETGDAGLIPSIPYNYINYNGEKYEMSASEYTEYKKLYGQNAYELMSDLFNTSTYKAASSEERADMVNRVYDFARDEVKREYFAKYGVEFTNATKDGEEYYKENSIKGAIEYDMTPDEYEFVTENPEKYKFLNDAGVSYEDYKNGSEDFKDAYSWAFKNPEKFTVSKAVASDVVTYRKYASELYDIKADKDEDGKSISGSRKEKVIEYVNNLDIDYGARLILFKSEYNADDTYNYDIINYLNSREDISYEEMETILKELGFIVQADGTILWD